MSDREKTESKAVRRSGSFFIAFGIGMMIAYFWSIMSPEQKAEVTQSPQAWTAIVFIIIGFLVPLGPKIYDYLK